MSRPWTPGPWTVEESDHGSFYGILVDKISPAIDPLVIDYGGDWALDVSDEDAQLIALAPEMAEAIFEEVSHHGDGNGHDSEETVCGCNTCILADKLRAIGASDDTEKE